MGTYTEECAKINVPSDHRLASGTNSWFRVLDDPEEHGTAYTTVLSKITSFHLESLCEQISIFYCQDK